MSETVLTGRGGPGRGQGRKRIAVEGEEAIYKLRMTQAQRRKIDQLGGATWLREQIETCHALASYDERKPMKNLSARYIRALRQLPQFHCNADPGGVLTHLLTGVRVLPLGDVEDEDDETGLLQLVFSGGHTTDVVGSMYFEMMVAEGAKLEVEMHPGEFGIPERKFDFAQRRTQDLSVHLRRKHDLN